jgi:dephospho-CoA kinase
LIDLFRYAVALTGGIGTGKSTVSKTMERLGLRVIDADTIAHRVLDVQSRHIAEMFGNDIVHGGRVDRKALGSIVFSDEVERKKLEGLLHPLIQQEIEAQASKLDKLGEPYLIDIPLFYERNTYPISRVLVVHAPKKLQITRLMERNGLSKTEALQRIGAQMDIEQKRDKTTYLIDNTGDLEQLKRECRRVYTEIVTDFADT